MTTSPDTGRAALDNELALYVHWPFCVSKCPYCDFNSHVVDTVDHGEWRDALLRELDFEAQRNPGAKLQSIFFGGGTPSLMDASTTKAVIESAKTHWQPIDDLEITLEANPGTVDLDRFAAFQDAGINRLSLGVQSLDDEQLKFLGRGHTAAEARLAVQRAGDVFGRLSFDLIYARPGHTASEWKSELSEALELLISAGGRHLSCYQLTIEEHTPFKTEFDRGAFTLPDEDGGSDLFDLTQDILAAAGLPAYEVSNHAGTGDACRHNVHVWQGGAYVGIGPGAHGRINSSGIMRSTQRLKPPAQWLKRVAAEGHGSQSETVLTAQQRAEEMVMLALRLDSGLDLIHLEHATELSRHDVISEENMAALVSEGLLKMSENVLQTTRRGRLVLNGIIQTLLS
ncbi:MAG: coproporphyrinogen III oxidase [Rhodospirillaceae bacterium]|jgi:putative oxygen-independent coproporphyrinogen III oxidase|nr:coproporphyrinogen III oxidase [Rhodospirillaceae bacterium]MBT5240845.1 coproporphyrinogen III oxidase [Rhodospirillaceae bacterium]MBT5564789.1 coproporphyrinogen III oxidase [Rhodospirillaceae bacterium]MBT6090182.1 coproporphyrinogen III oxidase [Rhodospirillaceae bacterium]MBT6962404.1 coproporphyrinogen III oxidase [Rhodospirillaceae bacterium]